MENKKGGQQNQVVTPSNETLVNETIPKLSHQHNTAPQHLRLLQYGLKLPNHQHTSASPSYPHQQANSPIHLHMHQHVQYQQAHRHPQTSPSPNQNSVLVTNNQQYNHQHTNNSHPSYQSLPPPPLHPHSTVTQNTPQIWVPHQPPVHYHHQQQQSQNKAESFKQPSPPQLQPKPRENLERKKSGSNVSHIRSPSAKRPPEAPVAMQGWLHKQGSEGLMLWKKRWFVLSEYCLFYYKGPEEEKLLGSILLPSYKVSVCGPEDKVNKKFSFKCEHANMRTYILAADSQELMIQWIRVLNMACLLQTNIENDQKLSVNVPSTNSPSADNTDSNLMKSYQQNQNFRTTPIHMHSSSNTTDLSNPSQQELSQYNQPLYANAPPKPRRLNDGGYSSPSPDALERYGNIPNQHYLTPIQTARNVTKSPVNIYAQSIISSHSPQPEYVQLVHRPKQNVYDYMFTPTKELHNIHQTVERRTPDTYGRSKLNPSKTRNPTDYEDVYAEQSMYKRPLSPIAYTHVKKVNPPAMNSPSNPAYRAYTPVNMLGPKHVTHYGPAHIRKSPSNIARPHSADFLEYEVQHRLNGNKQQPRPKSSLDINRNRNDSDNFYSEENYAEKMRKSAQYLPKMPRYSNSSNEFVQPQQRVPNRYTGNEGSFPLMRSSTQPIQCPNAQSHSTPNNPQPTRSRSVLSEGSLSKELDFDLRSSPREYHERILSPAFVQRPENYNFNEPIRNLENEQFTRSASARVAQNNDRPQDGRLHPRDGDKKREESMKRLLEWKQRMLQSPLNRKAQVMRPVGRPEYYCKNPENGYIQREYVDPSQDKRSFNTLPQYNSYSSDDEENEDGSKENAHSQAGRTLDTFPTISETLKPAQTSSIPVFNGPKESDKSVSNATIFLNSMAHLDNLLRNDPQNLSTTSEEILTKPLKEFNKDSSNLAYVSSLKSEYSDKFETLTVTEIRSNGALVKSILAEFEKHCDHADKFQIESYNNMLITPTKDMESIIEENYMTMTPRKNVLSPRSSTNSEATLIFDEQEENPYVEMTQSIDICALTMQDDYDGNEQEPYELVSFSEKHEPVYMELKHPGSHMSQNTNSMSKLPDILISQNRDSRSIKSDSSDADDEASKDLNSLDTPSHPRFSLSDNFRPASYYLGASQIVPEFQDSSDSELVSPPPIPTSPPPLEDLENTDVSSIQELSSIEQKTEYKFSHTRNTDSYFGSPSKYTKEVSHSPIGKKSSMLSLLTLKDPDNLSISSNNENERKYSSRLSHNSDSDAELRFSISRDSDYERRLKRRPVSEKYCGELESLESANISCNGIEYDKYLTDLQISNMSFSSIEEQNSNKNDSSIHHDYENMYIIGFNYEKNGERAKTGTPPNRENIHVDRKSSLSIDEFVQRGRPDSSASTSAEICGLLLNSNRSTPSIRLNSSLGMQEMPTTSYFSDKRDISDNSCFNQSAPYYYSDLSMNTSLTDSSSTVLTLNNQRGAPNGNKRDITHIVNPIRCNSHIRNGVHSPHHNIIDNTFKLAAEARSVSVDFLNLTDKSGHIDKKNIYESDTLKRLKLSDSLVNVQSDPETRNLFPSHNNEKFFNGNDQESVLQRSHSLEGLLENALGDNVDAPTTQRNASVGSSTGNSNNVTEGSYLWEEDTIWRERLRSASQRHTKSMDDLDCIGKTKKIQHKKPLRGITRGVTYVNDNIYNMPLQDKQQKEIDNKLKSSDNKSEIRKEGSFILDREKLRQWDLLSSAPSDDQLSNIPTGQIPRAGNAGVEIGEGTICEPSESSNTQDTASGSISITTRDTFPRSISAKRIWTPNPSNSQSRSSTNLARPHEDQFIRQQQQNYYISQSQKQYDLNNEQSIYNSRKDISQINDKMKVSAGELLGRTHEELVLLLIQLRRQSANTLQAIENYYNEIDTLQAQLNMMDQAKRLENLQKLEQIKQHLIELEKQYEKGKPLVNLVDNMVKLGSLYRSPNDRSNVSPYIRDRLEFNQQIQERRLLAEERRDWNRLNPNHLQLQEKVQQLYQLDRLIQEESGTLQTLQKDKEDIERALGGLRHRLNKGFNDPAEIEHARKQQIILENDLSRVHLMLAQNSKKLEETVAGNARLEQELLVLKQKLQISRQQRGSPQFSNAGDSLPCVVGTSAMLESDLQRVQQTVGDLQKQRQELSMQVRQLTDRSANLQPSKNSNATGQNSQYLTKKKINSLWRETDLDTMSIVDHGESWDNQCNSITPLYINTEIKQSPDAEMYSRSLKSSDSTSDDIQCTNFLPNEKQEIKTVRIVKRESERRQRDREKTSTGKWDALLEEDDSSQNSSVLFRPTPIQKTQSSTMLSPTFESDKNIALGRHSSISSPSLPQFTESQAPSSSEKSPELSPIFQSEAARQIITEMSIQDSPKHTNRRAVPKEKRRHYTAPHNNLIMKSLNQLPTDDNAFDRMIMNTRRARDDLDMERALKRIDAPDVVRSTLSGKELKYNESTIDNILGTPNKISIPERYIPEQLPQLSVEEQEHRLRKVESIKKMLSDTTILSSNTNNLTDDKNEEKTPSSITNKATTKMIEEKKQREHLLQLNQILAKQVMEMSKIVAVKALQKLPLQPQQMYIEEEDLSPISPLPLYQQRDNFYS